MKLYYITRVSIPSNAAQSNQILSMCTAFSNERINFKLISPKVKQTNQIPLENKFKWTKVNIWTKFKYLEFAIKSLIEIIREPPSHVFTRDIVIAFAVSFFNIKVVYEAHKEPRTKTAKFLLKVLRYKNNFILLTISNALKKYYIEKYHFLKKEVLCFHDGVFLEDYDALRNISKKELRDELNLPIDQIVVTHTGSLHKGNDAKLFEYVVRNFNDILFVQVGGTKSDINKYKKIYENYKNIIFVGQKTKKNVIKYQLSSDLLFYALTKDNKLWWCTSPLKIFEYMATGIPILASNIGSISEILDDSNCILYNPDIEQSIIDGITTFLISEHENKKIADQALKDIAVSYTWSKRVNGILNKL